MRRCARSRPKRPAWRAAHCACSAWGCCRSRPGWRWRRWPRPSSRRRFVKVDLERRPVQHAEGGTVREVLVRDGQRVAQGQPLLVLGDVSVDADMNRLTYRVAAERASVARLEAEQALRAGAALARRCRCRGQGGCARGRADGQGEARCLPRGATALVGQTALLRAQQDKLAQEREALARADRAGRRIVAPPEGRARDQPRPARRTATSRPRASRSSKPRSPTTASSSRSAAANWRAPSSA